MNPGRVQAILDGALGAPKQFSNSEHYYFCPFCHHYKPKLAININKRMWHCWKCNSKGRTLISLLRRLDISRDQLAEIRAELLDEVRVYKTDTSVQVAFSLPAEFRPLHQSHNSFEYRHALNYVHSRGVSSYEIIRYNIGYCESGEYGGSIVLPSYGEDGSLNYFVCRSFHADSYWTYKLPRLSKNVVGFDSTVNWNYPIVLVEGAFDAIAVRRNAIPLFGTYVSPKLKTKIIERNVQNIYIALDQDALKYALDAARYFMDEGRNVFMVNCTGKDPSKIGFVETQRLIRSATPLRFSDLLKQRLTLS
jgi:DNA primase